MVIITKIIWLWVTSLYTEHLVVEITCYRNVWHWNFSSSKVLPTGDDNIASDIELVRIRIMMLNIYIGNLVSGSATGTFEYVIGNEITHMIPLNQ